MKRAMSTVKNIAAAAMTLAVVFGFASFKPVTANAAQAAAPATASVEEENSYFEEDAYQSSFLTLINNERAQAGLAPVALGDSSHNAAAMERAEELAVSYSYVRPNGQRDFTVLAENGISDVSIGEKEITLWILHLFTKLLMNLSKMSELATSNRLRAVAVWTSVKHPALKICWVYFRSILISH